MSDQYWLFYLLALVAEVIGTISGFGSSILFVPLASLFFDFKLVLGITAVFHVFSNIAKIYLFRHGVDRNVVLKLGIPAVLFVIIGAVLTTFIPQDAIALMMNVMLIILSFYLVINIEKNLEANNKNLVTGGMLSGFLAGLIGTGGAIRGLVLTGFGLEKNIFVATSAFIDLGVDLSRAVVYVSSGYFLKTFLPMIPFLIGISFLGSYIGKQILYYTTQRVFRYIVLVTIIITSIIQIVSYLNNNSI